MGNGSVGEETALTLWSAFCPMRLHCDVSVQMVEGAICLFAAIPAAFVHALNLFISSSRSLVLLRARDWNERVDGRQRMTTLVALVRISLLKQRKAAHRGRALY